MNKPKMKAHIKFCKFESALAMQVLYFDKRFNGNFYISKGNKICSTTDYILAYRWKKKIVFDFSSTYGVFCSNPCSIGINKLKNVNAYLDNLILCLKDWAKNWEGWKDEPAIEPVIKEYEGGVVEVMV